MSYSSLLKQQLSLGTLISNFLSNLQKIGQAKLTNAVYTARLELLEKYWSKFSNRHEELILFDEHTDSDYHRQDTYEAISEHYLDALTHLRSHLKTLPESSQTPPSKPSLSARLPKIQLPTFSGDHLQWETFRDLFTSTVHNAAGLSDATRLQYLKSLLTGEAAKVISNVAITNANYQGARESLARRYEDKRLLVAHHLDRLLQQQSMTREASDLLKSLLDTRIEGRRALQNLGRPVEHWDDWFVHLTVQKLHRSIRKDWETAIGSSSTMPTFADLTEFLTNSIRALSAVPSSGVTPVSRPRSSNQEQQKHLRSYHTEASNLVQTRQCALCHKPHHLRQCPRYQNATIPARRRLIQQHGLCYNYLGNHQVNACTSINRCRTCGNNHHSSLHEAPSTSSTPIPSTPLVSTSTTGTTDPSGLTSAHAQTASQRVTQLTLLATAMVRVTTDAGRSSHVRALLDQGSEATFISEELAQRLRVPRGRVQIPVYGVGATHCGLVKAVASIHLSPIGLPSEGVNTSAYVLPRLTQTFRPPKANLQPWAHLSHLQLADISRDTGPIDLVLGADKVIGQHRSRSIGPLTTEELRRSRKHFIIAAQRAQFGTELRAIKRGQAVPKESPLRSLRPFLDAQGVLRVGGRLHHAQISHEERHPIILSSRSRITELLIWDSHHRTLHGGPTLTHQHLLSSYWILRRRPRIRKLIHQCITCTRHRAKGETQLMGQLPEHRVTPSRPFSRVAVDYAGPIRLRTTRGRGHRSHKGYIALFVCLSTKAIHLEAVSDLFTAAFLAAFKRLNAASRRGLPTDVYSDQATNFRGADAALRAIFKGSSSTSSEIATRLANDQVQWHFIPPRSPHFGGLWEAGVKACKHHLRCVIGDSTLTYEELSTLLADIEACLNSRPITPLSTDPEELTALTPGHFLIGAPLKSLPGSNHATDDISHQARWKLLQNMRQHFWQRWSSEYLHQLQQRNKWGKQAANLGIGDMVLLKEDCLPPAKWRLGRIQAVHPGPDRLVRVADVRTPTGLVRRLIHKLCRLPVTDPSS